jgi:protein required for attachment to host cells
VPCGFFYKVRKLGTGIIFEFDACRNTSVQRNKNHKESSRYKQKNTDIIGYNVGDVWEVSMIWVITANAIACRIYDYKKSPAELTLIKEIFHPENRLKKEEFLTSDKPGHYKSSSSNRGAFSPRTDPKEVEIDNFARQIAKEMDAGRKMNAFNKIILVTPPHMEGLIFQHADKHVKDMVINNIKKDPQHFSEKDLLKYLKEYAQFSDK